MCWRISLSAGNWSLSIVPSGSSGSPSKLLSGKWSNVTHHCQTLPLFSVSSGSHFSSAVQWCRRACTFVTEAHFGSWGQLPHSCQLRKFFSLLPLKHHHCKRRLPLFHVCPSLSLCFTASQRLLWKEWIKLQQRLSSGRTANCFPLHFGERCTGVLSPLLFFPLLKKISFKRGLEA